MDNLVQIFSSGSTGIGVWMLMFAASFAGGVLASISPCSLAMPPLIIGYVGGYSKETPLRTFIQLCCFIFGTGSVFASTLGGYFTLIMASLLLVMGLKLTDVLEFDMPVIIKAMPVNNTNSLFLYPVLLGIAFALAGTPCSTPILAGIMAFAAMGKNLAAAVLMLFLFAVGQGLILIIAGLFTSGVKNLKNFAGMSAVLLKVSGVLLILVALYLYYKTFAPLI